MDREGIIQRVLDTLGIIIVDKTQIHEQATLAELMLDEDDVQALFQRLQAEFDCTFPDFIQERARQRPEHVSVPMLVELVLLIRQERAPLAPGGPSKRC